MALPKATQRALRQAGFARAVRPFAGSVSARAILERAQDQRETARLLYEWGGWWEPDERRLGAGETPLPPPVHRVATDRCEQQQVDGSWQVLDPEPKGQALCAVCHQRYLALQARRVAIDAEIDAEMGWLRCTPPPAYPGGW